MTFKSRKTGSVRLSEVQYTEMQRLGIDSESAYIRHKLEQGQTKLEVLKTPIKTEALNETELQEQLTIQRLTLENNQLKNQLETSDHNNREALNGVNQRVHTMLQDELFKRDFETLKKEHTQREAAIKKLEEELSAAKKESASRKEEIEALVKKLGFLELGKAFIPSAISGLAKHYPNQMRGIAGTLGQLGLEQGEIDSEQIGQEDHLQQVIDYLRDQFSDTQFEQTLQLMMSLAEHIKADTQIIEKVNYYLNQLQNKTKTEQTDAEVHN